MTGLRVLLIILFIFSTKIGNGQNKSGQLLNDTLYFKKNVDTLNEQQAAKMISKVGKGGNYTVVAFTKNKTRRQTDLSWNRGHNVYETLIANGADKDRIRFLYGIIGQGGMVVIRPSNEEELNGTNCGVPIFPDLSKYRK